MEKRAKPANKLALSNSGSQMSLFRPASASCRTIDEICIQSEKLGTIIITNFTREIAPGVFASHKQIKFPDQTGYESYLEKLYKACNSDLSKFLRVIEQRAISFN